MTEWNASDSWYLDSFVDKFIEWGRKQGLSDEQILSEYEKLLAEFDRGLGL